MVLNAAGIIVRDEWLKCARMRSEYELDEFVVMPNHFHAIIKFSDTVGAIHELPLQQNDAITGMTSPNHESPLQMTRTQRRNMGLSKLIGRFKMLSAKQINAVRQSHGIPVWQRNYYEHIIRSETELNRIREYVTNNPANWEKDDEYKGVVTS